MIPAIKYLDIWGLIISAIVAMLCVLASVRLAHAQSAVPAVVAAVIAASYAVDAIADDDGD